MITLNVFFDVKQESEGAFVKLLDNMVVQSGRESGCELYELHHKVAQPLSYVLVEHWTTQQDLDEHGQTDHWTHFDATVNQYLYSPYDEHHYTEISS